MKFPRRLHLHPLLSLILCCVLLASSLIPTSIGKATSPALGQRSSSSPQTGRGRKVRAEAAQPGAPAAAVPNLDDVRQQPQLIVQTPSPIFSTERSRRKPLVSRGGRRVGDPLPTPTATPTTPPLPSPTPSPLPSPVPSPTVLPSPPMPVIQGASGAPPSTLSLFNSSDVTKAHAFYFTRFLIAPFDDQTGLISDSRSGLINST